MDLFDIAVAKKMSGGGGGGGSSDFTTATVTVTALSAHAVYVAATTDEDDPSTLSGFSLTDNETLTLTVVLYKGSALFESDNGTISVTGDIDPPPFPGFPACYIHGAGTITIS